MFVKLQIVENQGYIKIDPLFQILHDGKIWQTFSHKQINMSLNLQSKL